MVDSEAHHDETNNTDRTRPKPGADEVIVFDMKYNENRATKGQAGKVIFGREGTHFKGRRRPLGSGKFSGAASSSTVTEEAPGPAA